MNNRKWWPTSKMTAVGFTGSIYVAAVAGLGEMYGVELHPVDVAAVQLLILFGIGYAITENRGNGWNP